MPGWLALSQEMRGLVVIYAWEAKIKYYDISHCSLEYVHLVPSLAVDLEIEIEHALFVCSAFWWTRPFLYFVLQKHYSLLSFIAFRVWNRDYHSTRVYRLNLNSRSALRPSVVLS